jgi:integrase
VDRLYKYTGAKKVSFYYQYPNGSSETLASAPLGDRQAIAEAERAAKRKAMDIQQGKVIAGSVADMIDRFEKDIDPTHYKDQSKDGKAVRKGTYANLIKFFGGMHPMGLKALHGYQYIEARTKAGAPAKAVKEMALMTTICHRAVKWGLMERNPFVGMQHDKRDKDVRTIERRHVIRFYLWSQRQDNQVFKTMGCAALFTYLTGYRAAEVRPFHASGLTDEGVRVLNAKRKKGEEEITKVREWSRKLRTVVKRAQQAHGRERLYLFANRHGKAYTRSGWGSVWQDAMVAYLGCKASDLVEHPMYFSLLDIRPAAITKKAEQRAADLYDFAAHANPATTHRHYDRRKVKKASATE